MVVVKIIIRILLLPVRICLTLIQLMLMFSTWLSATVFHALSGIICITAVLGYGFGQETGTEASRMLLVGFILYILPVLFGWAVMWLETIKIRLMGDKKDGINGNMEEFLNDLIGKRMEQVYQEKDGEQYDPFNEELELKVQKVIRKLPPKQGKVIFDYMTEISNNNSDLNEFYYRMGLRDGLKLRKAIQTILDTLIE